MRALAKTCGDYLVLASFFGLASGLLEIGFLLCKQWFLNDWMLPTPQSTLWLIPLADLAIFVGAGMAFGLLAGIVPEFYNRRFALFAFGFILVAKVLLLVGGLHQAVLIWLAVAVGWQSARIIAHRYARLRSLLRYATLLLLILAFAYGAGSLYRQHAGPLWQDAGLPPAGSPNVLLITLDTVRARSLSLYGYDRRTSPHLERWAARGVVFERAYATAPWTFPSHAAMFTGRYSTELSLDFSSALGHSAPTLAEVLSKSGYATAGFVANRYWCTRDTGLHRGFAVYNEYSCTPAQAIRSAKLARTVLETQRCRRLLGEYDDYGRRSADDLNRDFFAWLPRVGKRPFFAFMNFFDAHDPYLPPVPYDALFGPPISARERAFLSIWWGRDKRHLPAQGIDLARRAYDSCIAYLDACLGRLLDELDKRGILDNTLVIIAADHGDQFDDHGLWLHGNSLYSDLLHVPLLMICPRQIPAAMRVRSEVTLRDVPATVLDVAGLSRSALPGHSLARHWTPTSYDLTAETSPVMAVAVQRSKIVLRSCCPLQRGSMISLIENGKHYIRIGKDEEQVFDLNTDPRQARDLAKTGDAKESQLRMRNRVQQVLEQHRSAGSTTAGHWLND